VEVPAPHAVAPAAAGQDAPVPNQQPPREPEGELEVNIRGSVYISVCKIWF
jgi:hypothetical protein